MRNPTTTEFTKPGQNSYLQPRWRCRIKKYINDHFHFFVQGKLKKTKITRVIKSETKNTMQKNMTQKK